MKGGVSSVGWNLLDWAGGVPGLLGEAKNRVRGDSGWLLLEEGQGGGVKYAPVDIPL
jgi:hypothetical protein